MVIGPLKSFNKEKNSNTNIPFYGQACTSRHIYQEEKLNYTGEGRGGGGGGQY